MKIQFACAVFSGVDGCFFFPGLVLAILQFITLRLTALLAARILSLFPRLFGAMTDSDLTMQAYSLSIRRTDLMGR